MYSIDDNGNLTLVQGDDIRYPITGLPTDKNYTVCFAIYNEKRQAVGDEVNVLANYAASITFSLKPALTDLLTVKKSEDTATYYFGLKLCYPEDDAGTITEDTLLIGSSTMGELNSITVYPKKVEGTAYAVTETTDDTTDDTTDTAEAE